MLWRGAARGLLLALEAALDAGRAARLDAGPSAATADLELEKDLDLLRNLDSVRDLDLLLDVSQGG